MTFLYYSLTKSQKKSNIPPGYEALYHTIVTEIPEVLPELREHNKAFELYKEYLSVKLGKDDFKNYSFVQEHKDILKFVERYGRMREKYIQGENVENHFKASIKQYLYHLDFWNVRYYIRLFLCSDFEKSDGRSSTYSQIYIIQNNRKKDQKISDDNMIMVKSRMRGPNHSKFDEDEWRKETFKVPGQLDTKPNNEI